MTTEHEPRRIDIHGAPRRANTTSSWRYWAILAATGLLAAVASVQTFGGDVSAATLEPEPTTLPYDPRAVAPLPEVVAPVPFL
jgi:hypothetical protein